MSEFKEWFTSNVTEYTFLCEQFYLDCELIDTDLRKQRLRDWIEYAYKAGQQTKGGTMKLYRVSVETEVMVVAENEEDAENQASNALNQISDNEPFEFYAQEVKDKKELKEWVNCIPYGGSSDKPCLEYMIEDIP